MLHIQNFTKSYHNHPVLEIPELVFPDGLHWIRGGNGSGKSTFFKAIAGMLPFEGEIWLDNLEINKNPTEFRMLVNYGEAEPGYPEYLSALDLASFVAKTKKAPVGQLDAFADALGVSQFWEQPSGKYSSGMLKKTSLLLAFLGQPKWIILDEPLITIDDVAVTTLVKIIAQNRTTGVSFLLSSHQDFRLAEIHTDSQFIIKDKHIQPI